MGTWTRFALLCVVALTIACRRDPRLAMQEAPPELQGCVPAGDQNGSVVEVRFGLDGRGLATHGCFSATHDAACIRAFVDRSSRGDRGMTRRMLVARTTIKRPDGGTAHVGLVTFSELGDRDPGVLGGACAMHPL